MLDVEAIRKVFPALERQLGGRPVIFADNAATSLKPLCVIQAVDYYYRHLCANVHRGVNVLAQEADALYEDSRNSIASLIHARPAEVIFVRNTTEAINLAAHLLDLTKKDDVICSLTEHHSNFLPWLARANVRCVAPDERGRVTPGAFLEAATPKTKLFALGHVSNVTGVVSPVADIIQEARKRGILTLVDAAQSVSHMPLDVQSLGCDFLAFSGHKMFGPSGIGVLWAREEFLKSRPPMLFGGGMVTSVSEDGFQVQPPPHGFEAGTPNIEGTLGMGAAAQFLMGLDMDNVRDHSRRLAEALINAVASVSGLRAFPLDSSADRVPIVSFAVGSMSPDDVAAILCNRYNIMVRSGVHCAEPLVRHFGQRGLVRVSLSVYNTLDEIAYIGESLKSLSSILAR